MFKTKSWVIITCRWCYNGNRIFIFGNGGKNVLFQHVGGWGCVNIEFLTFMNYDFALGNKKFNSNNATKFEKFPDYSSSSFSVIYVNVRP